MRDELVKLETAKLAKEKGFDLDCLHFYVKSNCKMYGLDEYNRSYPIQNSSQNKLYTIGEHTTIHLKNVYFAPTQSLLHRWLREVHNISLYSAMDLVSIKEAPARITWFFAIQKSNYHDRNTQETDHTSKHGYKAYEEALEVGLQEALKLI